MIYLIKLIPILFLCLCLPALSKENWNHDIFKSVDIQEYFLDKESDSTFPKVPLLLIFDKQTDWNTDNILERLNIASDILLQCRLSLSKIKIAQVELTQKAKKLTKLLNKDDIEGSIQSMKLQAAIAEATPKQNGVISYFLSSNKNSPIRFNKTAWAFGSASIERFKRVPLFKGINLEPLKSTTWMFSSLLEDGAWQRNIPKHSVLAHELMHTIGEYSKHPSLSYPNIMNSNSSLIGNYLNEDQCEALRNSKLHE